MFVNQKSETDSSKMINHAAIEAMNSAVYIENYMDFVENVPDDIQRNITQLRELDLQYQGNSLYVSYCFLFVLIFHGLLYIPYLPAYKC